MWRFMGRRISPEGYLGLHFTVGLLLSLLALVVFGEVAEAVMEQHDITRFDTALANVLHRAATLVGLAIFRTCTLIGFVSHNAAAWPNEGVVLLGRGQWRILLASVLGFAGGSIFNLMLKIVFQRPRLYFTDAFVIAGGWAFPVVTRWAR